MHKFLRTNHAVNQGLSQLAFFGLAVNLVLFLRRVLDQGNAVAANNVSKWTGTVYLCSLIGAFLSDSYWGRYMACTIFQLILLLVINIYFFRTNDYLIRYSSLLMFVMLLFCYNIELYVVCYACFELNRA